MSRHQLLLTEDEKIRGTDTQRDIVVVLQNVEDDRNQSLLSESKALDKDARWQYIQQLY